MLRAITSRGWRRATLWHTTGHRCGHFIPSADGFARLYPRCAAPQTLFQFYTYRC